MVAPISHDRSHRAIGKQNVYMNKYRASTLEECSELFESLFNQCYRPLSYVVKEYFEDEETIEEIVFVVFEKVWSGIVKGSIGNEQLNKAYIRKMAKNECINRKEELKKTSSLELLNRDVADATIEERLDEKGLAQFWLILVDWIEGLPEQQRRVMTLIFFEGRKPSEAADLLGLSPQTVYRHRSDALETIRRMTKERGIEFDVLPLWGLSFFSYLIQ